MAFVIPYQTLTLCESWKLVQYIRECKDYIPTLSDTLLKTTADFLFSMAVTLNRVMNVTINSRGDYKPKEYIESYTGRRLGMSQVSRLLV